WSGRSCVLRMYFFFQAEDGIRDFHVTGVQTCALPIWLRQCLWTPFTPVWVTISGSEGSWTATASQKPARLMCARSTRMRFSSSRSEERRVGKECRAGWGREHAREEQPKRRGRGTATTP